MLNVRGLISETEGTGQAPPAFQQTEPQWDEVYHENSKYSTRLLATRGPNFAALAKAVRKQPPEPTDTIPLPGEGQLQPMTGSLHAALSQRRTVRGFAGSPIPLDTLALLLRESAGITGKVDLMGPIKEARAYPSAGALYGVQLHLMVRQVDGLRPGLYRYLPETHSLCGLGEPGDYLEPLLDASPLTANRTKPEVFIQLIPLVLFLTADLTLLKAKYGQRAYRFIFQEAGHLAQNLSLVCTALGLGSVVLGGFYDDAVAEILQLKGPERFPICVMPVGKPLPVPAQGKDDNGGTSHDS